MIPFIWELTGLVNVHVVHGYAENEQNGCC